jgi:hypothetical protein
MRNLSMLTPMVSIFCLFVLLYHITTASSTNPHCIAAFDIKLDCGSDRNSKDLVGRNWTGDNLKFFPRLNVGGSLISPTEDTGLFREWSPDINYFKGAGVVPHNASLIPKFSIISNCTAPDDVYRSARSMGPNNTKNLQSNLTWGLPVDSGFNYLVRLHFCELIINKIFGQRRFIIYIDYQLAEEDADVL